MKRILNLIVSVVLVTVSFYSTKAVPAYPEPIEFRQPDGSTIIIILKGDEKVKWAETTDGYSILFNKEGYYEYAILDQNGDMIPSGVRVNDTSKRSDSEVALLQKLPKGLFYSSEQVGFMKQIWSIEDQKSEKNFPTTGDRKLVCILVNFLDKSFVKTQTDFDNLFNQINYTASGATGSVKDYYLENSYGQFNLTVDVVGPYTLSQNMAYYGANDTYGNDVNPRAMVREAVTLANSAVNFSDYDNDDDGYVDGVYVIYAGYGEASGGASTTIWPHAWVLYPAEYLDGVYIYNYSCSSELLNNYGSTISSIGVVCHEFGHVLGAPDYYDTNYSTGGSFTGTGNWDMMAGGSWNNSGRTPAHHNGFTKTVIYEWAELKTLDYGTSMTLYNSVDSSNSYYRVNTKTENEYFLLEYRERHKFDEALPGSGLLIYHVHKYVMTSMNNNSINNTHPQRMYPVSQNATTDPNSSPSSYGNINFASCVWNGTGKREFSDVSLPSSKSWDGVNTEKPITNIMRNASDLTVTFDFMGGVPNVDNFTAEPTSQNQIDLSWQLSSELDVMLAYSKTNEFGNPVNGETYEAGETIEGGGSVIYFGNDNAFTHSGLTSRTEYFYKIWVKQVDGLWSTGEAANATTFQWIITEFPWFESFEEVNTIPDWWWIETQTEDSEEWTIVAENGTSPAAALDGTNFAILMDNDETMDSTLLVSPELNLITLSTAELSFWYYSQENEGAQDELRVYYKTSWDAEWELIPDAEYTESTTEWQKAVVSLPEPLTTTYYIAFEGYTQSGYGVSVDSIYVYGEPKPLYTLTLNFVGEGSVEVNDEVYTEGVTVLEGTELTLKAIADYAWQFDNWSGDLTSTDNPTSIVMDSDKEVTVTFTEVPNRTLTINVIGNGSVEVNDVAYSVPVSVLEGTELLLEAIADQYWSFQSWSNDFVSTDNPATITMDADKIVTVTFTELPMYTLTITIVGNGIVNINSEPYSEPISVYQGTNVTLQAVPSTGWNFTGWSGSLYGSMNPVGLAIYSNSNITATFTNPTSVDVDDASLVQIYPNPFSENLHISNIEQYNSLSIINLIGQKILELEISGQQDIVLSTEGLTKGIYMITLSKNSGERIIRKAIKK